jgi:hypothetical protein
MYEVQSSRTCNGLEGWRPTVVAFVRSGMMFRFPCALDVYYSTSPGRWVDRGDGVDATLHIHYCMCYCTTDTTLLLSCTCVVLLCDDGYYLGSIHHSPTLSWIGSIGVRHGPLPRFPRREPRSGAQYLDSISISIFISKRNLTVTVLLATR